MMLLKRLNVMNWLKRVNTIQTTDASNLVKKTDYDTKNSEIEKNMLIVITVISTLLHKNLII